MVYSLAVGVLAFLVALAIGRPLVPYLRRRRVGKAIGDQPASHAVKAGTPTMGGLMIFGAVILVTIPANLVGHWSILLPLGMIGVTGLMGFWDDLQTLQGRKGKGLSWRFKLTALSLLGLLAGAALYAMDIHSANVPWLGRYDLSYAYIPLAAAIIVATTTGVAITDGLDGLAGGTVAIAFIAYTVIARIQEQIYLATFSLTVAGAILGFLWYNAHPARIIMGDTGAMALGSTLAVVSLMTGHWLLLPVVGLVFVAEAASDVIQVGYFKWTRRRTGEGKRVFRMTPLHHHFELLGWPEPQVVIRFWIVAIVAGLVGVALALQV
ncbi:MAG TPA: phospho-N-acetylmuramoyl-pentapeptide-transferase [Dehalococcoidia bacterium]